jgi:hypothetical protein
MQKNARLTHVVPFLPAHLDYACHEKYCRGCERTEQAASHILQIGMWICSDSFVASHHLKQSFLEMVRDSVKNWRVSSCWLSAESGEVAAPLNPFRSSGAQLRREYYKAVF